METKLEQIAAKAVKQRPKSVVREIRTPRSVGTGGGRPPPLTRWRPVMGVPTAIASSARLEAEILLLQGAHRRWMAQHGRSSVGLSEPLPENGAKPGFSRRFAMRRA